MPLLALDLFARIVAMRVDAGPLFLRFSRFWLKWRSGCLLVALVHDTAP
jgi:hypothetical protein